MTQGLIKSFKFPNGAISVNKLSNLMEKKKKKRI